MKALNKWLNKDVKPQTKENVYIEPKKSDNVETGKASRTIYPTDKKSN